jgi:hypothetical protein
MNENCEKNLGGRKIKHGHNTRKHGRSREYITWDHMKRRCLDPKHIRYPNYGGRGISVCDRWLTFENFLTDMGARPQGTTLDRINNDENIYYFLSGFAVAVILFVLFLKILIK